LGKQKSTGGISTVDFCFPMGKQKSTVAGFFTINRKIRQIVVLKNSNCRFLFSLGKTKTYSWYANCRFWFSFD
jgi:hypothetical protein